MKYFLPLIDSGSGSVKANFIMSLMEAFEGRDVHVRRFSDSLVPRARNRAAADFLESNCDYLLFVDCDIIFNSDHICFLEESDEDVLCGIYLKKEGGISPCLQTLELNKPYPVGGRIEVARSGSGFMRISRSALEKIKNNCSELKYTNHGRDEWDFFSVGVRKSEYLSEDWGFCDRWRELGGKVMLDTRIQLRHEGAAIYPLQDTVEKDDKWRQIHGWFDFEELYERIAKRLPEGAKFAEIGVWMGRSLAAMARYCELLGKTVHLHAVDTFAGTKSEPKEKALHDTLLAACGGNLKAVFQANMINCGVNGNLVIHEGKSVDRAVDFQNEELDAVFIDADHNEDAVLDDISSWLPKVKRGGILAGHDYDYESVKKAVDWFFYGPQDKIETVGRCWLYIKP